MEIDMNEFMALEVREDATDSAKELRAMALAAQARIIAEKAIAARNGSKQFQMEQRIELDKLNAKVMDGMTQEEALAFKSEFLNQLRIADEQETHDDAASYVQSQKRTQPTEAKQYKLSTKLEYAVEENEENIVPLTRKEYVVWVRAQQRKTAKGPSSFRVEPNIQNRWSSSSPVGMWAGRLPACPHVHGAGLARGCHERWR
jgi:hypothetical protein